MCLKKTFETWGKMTLLGKKFDYLDDEEQEKDGYHVPAVFRQNPKEYSLKKSIILSTILHPVVAGAIWLTLIILTLLGITIPLFNKPEPKPKDIEFVLVNKEATPINKNTKYRADKNSRAGGKHDPKRKVSMPQAAAPKAAARRQSSPPPPTPAVKRTPKKQSSQSAAPKQNKIFDQPPLPMFAPRPNAKPSPPKPTAKPKGDFAIPIPKSAIPTVAEPSGGPVSGTARGKSSGTSGSGSSSRPSPSFSPSSSSGTGTGGGRFSGSYGSGGGNIGNPGPGNPKGAPGIDAIREPDFGPYMRELQRRIKMNWEPPKGNESKRVVLLFVISRDGRLLNVKVHKSSGMPEADRAAISAVQLTAPFKPLPPEYKGNSVDIQFTFDYNVFGASRY